MWNPVTKIALLSTLYVSQFWYVMYYTFFGEVFTVNNVKIITDL